MTHIFVFNKYRAKMGIDMELAIGRDGTRTIKLTFTFLNNCTVLTP